MKIVMVRSHFPDFKLNKTAESLLKDGHSIDLLVWSRRNSDFNVNKKIKIKKMNLNVSAGGLKVALYLPFFWVFIIFQLLTQKWDIAHCVDFDTLIPTLVIAKIKRKPVVYDIFDFYADTIEFPILPKLFRNFYSRLDKYFMQFVDLVIIVDKYRKEQIEVTPKELEIIYNSPPDLLDTINYKEKTDNRFSIFFGGRVSKDRCLNEIIQIIKELDDAKLTVMGFCEPPEYKEEIERIKDGANNIELNLEFTEHKELLNETSKSDLIIAMYNPEIPNNVYSSPNKLFESMMCGKPILVSKKTSVSYIVEEEECGFVASYGDVGYITKCIIELKNDPKLCENLGKNGRKAYEEKYSWELMEKKLIKAYEKFDLDSKNKSESTINRKSLKNESDTKSKFNKTKIYSKLYSDSVFNLIILSLICITLGLLLIPGFIPLIMNYNKILPIILVMFLVLRFIFNETPNNAILKFLIDKSIFFIVPLLIIFTTIVIYRTITFSVQ